MSYTVRAGCSFRQIPALGIIQLRYKSFSQSSLRLQLWCWAGFLCNLLDSGWLFLGAWLQSIDFLDINPSEKAMGTVLWLNTQLVL